MCQDPRCAAWSFVRWDIGLVSVVVAVIVGNLVVVFT